MFTLHHSDFQIKKKNKKKEKKEKKKNNPQNQPPHQKTLQPNKECAHSYTFTAAD